MPLVDLDQGATTSFPVSGFVTTKQWATKYPHTLAAFYQAFEQGQQIADTDRAAAATTGSAPTAAPGAQSAAPGRC